MIDVAKEASESRDGAVDAGAAAAARRADAPPSPEAKRSRRRRRPPGPAKPAAPSRPGDAAVPLAAGDDDDPWEEGRRAPGLPYFVHASRASPRGTSGDEDALAAPGARALDDLDDLGSKESVYETTTENNPGAWGTVVDSKPGEEGGTAWRGRRAAEPAGPHDARRAMRTMWGGGADATPGGCYAVAAACSGNTAYQANNFVGAAEALYALGAPRSDPGVRFLMHLACGLAVLGTLFFADVDRVSAGLGVVSVLMIVTFAFALSQLGLDGGELVLGLLPSKPPGRPARQAPDAGGSLGAAVSGMRRGVTLATAIALVLSVLIVATGAGVARHVDDDGAFSVEPVDALRRRGRLRRGLLRARPVRGGVLERADRRARRGALLRRRCSARDGDDRRWRQPDGPYTRGVIVFVVLVAVVVGSSGASTVGVVLMAQVINGVLLPVVALCCEVEMRPSAPSRAPESPSTANPLRVRTDSDSDDDPRRPS
ncbi:hypothetical protein JL721_7883 [Aureococcus anophagefferens]|nr:hypothetical protein JL721_7883 [Aureococcus anophagefferens]